MHERESTCTFVAASRRLNLYFYEQSPFLINAYKNYYRKKGKGRIADSLYLFLSLIDLKIDAPTARAIRKTKPLKTSPLLSFLYFVSSFLNFK